MKLLKKCTPIMLALIFSVQPVQVFAQNAEAGNTITSNAIIENTINMHNLTVNQAARRAIENSSSIRNMQDSAVLSREREQSLRDDMFSPMMNMATFMNTSALLMESELERALSIESIEAQRDTLDFIVRNHFANIIRAEKALEISNASIELAERDIIILEVMVSLGLESYASLDLARLNFERTLNTRESLISSINEAHIELNRIMGSPLNRRYNLIFDVEFEELGSVNLTRYLNDHTRNSISIRQARNELDAAQFRLDNHVAPINMMTGELLSGGVSRDVRITNVNIAARAVQDARTDIESSVMATYNQIRNMEIGLNSSLLQLESMQRELEILNTQLRLGQITPIEVDRYKLGIMELEENIRQQKINHSLVVMQLRNPNILI